MRITGAARKTVAIKKEVCELMAIVLCEAGIRLAHHRADHRWIQVSFLSEDQLRKALGLLESLGHVGGFRPLTFPRVVGGMGFVCTLLCSRLEREAERRKTSLRNRRPETSSEPGPCGSFSSESLPRLPHRFACLCLSPNRGPWSRRRAGTVSCGVACSKPNQY